jgi:hypothetical protein
MKLEVAQKIVEAADMIGLDVQIREGYSGRGMFGKSTTGLVGSKTDIVRSIAKAAFEIGAYSLDPGADFEEFYDELDLTWDNMGKDHLITY